MSNEHFVVLCSDSRKGEKTSDFTNILTRPLILDNSFGNGTWLVSLDQLITTNSMDFLKTSEKIRIVFQTKLNKKVFTCTVSPGNYTVDTLINELEKLIPRDSSVVFQFDPVRQRINLNFDPEIVVDVQISEKLRYMMGFPFFSNKSPGPGRFMPELTSKNPIAFVYSSCVAPSFVGDKEVQLLRIVPFNNIPLGGIVDKSFAMPQYRPVSTTQPITSINIKLMDRFGEPLAQNFGVTYCILHFIKSKAI